MFTNDNGTTSPIQSDNKILIYNKPVPISSPKSKLIIRSPSPIKTSVKPLTDAKITGIQIETQSSPNGTTTVPQLPPIQSAKSTRDEISKSPMVYIIYYYRVKIRKNQLIYMIYMILLENI